MCGRCASKVAASSQALRQFVNSSFLSERCRVLWYKEYNEIAYGYKQLKITIKKSLRNLKIFLKFKFKNLLCCYIE